VLGRQAGRNIEHLLYAPNTRVMLAHSRARDG
jgi:hypothetical protein